jgi:hypothetical protein
MSLRFIRIVLALLQHFGGARGGVCYRQRPANIVLVDTR